MFFLNINNKVNFVYHIFNQIQPNELTVNSPFKIESMIYSMIILYEERDSTNKMTLNKLFKLRMGRGIVVAGNVDYNECSAIA